MHNTAQYTIYGKLEYCRFDWIRYSGLIHHELPTHFRKWPHTWVGECRGHLSITVHLKDSSYRPQLSSQSSQIEEDEEEIEEEEEKTAADFFLVAKANLEPLFRRCQDCGGLIDPISMEWIQIASALSVKFQCTECKVHFRWDSQSKKGTGKSQVFQLNQELPIAAFVTGTPFPVIY